MTGKQCYRCGGEHQGTIDPDMPGFACNCQAMRGLEPQSDKYAAIREWAETNPEALRRTVVQLNGDGHTIWKPERFPDMPHHLLPISLHRSDGSLKGNLEGLSGEYVTELEGVYGLVLSDQLVSALGLEQSGMAGRGWRARANRKVINEWLDNFTS